MKTRNYFYLILVVGTIVNLDAMSKSKYIPMPNVDEIYKLKPEEQVEAFKTYIKKARNVPVLYTAVNKWSQDPFLAPIARDNKTLVLAREFKILYDIQSNIKDILSTVATQQVLKLDRYMERVDPYEEQSPNLNQLLKENHKDSLKRIEELKDIFSSMLANYSSYFAPPKQTRALEILIENGANPNATFQGSGPALRYVISMIVQKMQKSSKNLGEEVEIAKQQLKILLEAGADPDLHPGIPPYTEQLAKLYTPEALQLIELLLKYGAQITPGLVKKAEDEQQKGNPELFNLIQFYIQKRKREEIFHAFERGE